MTQWLDDVARLRAHRLRGLLFLCVANSARSQLAEALARRLAPPDVEVFSAGSAPRDVHPLTIRALAEIGVDTAGLRSKSVAEIPADRVDAVVTLCTEEACPVFAGHAVRVHWELPDPAGGGHDEQDALARFRRVRDELDRRLRALFAR